MEHFLFSGFFWGGILVVGGLLLIVNSIFHFNIPTFKILFALVLISIGISLLTSTHKWQGMSGPNFVIFNESRMEMSKDLETQDFSVIFGKGEVDLTSLATTGKNYKIQVSAVFGAVDLILSNSQPIRIRANSAFGGIDLPEHDIGGFGNQIYQSPGYSEDKPHLDIELNAVFGGARVLNR